MIDHPTFDASVFDLLQAELGVEDTIEVLKTFLADTGRKIDICAAGALDPALLIREVHAIKSSAATFGFMELSSQARTIERNAAGTNAEEIRDSIAALRDIFGRTSSFAQSVLLTREVETA